MRNVVRKLGPVAILIASGCTSTPPPAIQHPAPQVPDAGPSRSSSGCSAVGPAAVADGTITIHPGETLCVRLQVQGDSIVPSGLLETAGTEAMTVTLARESGPTLTMLTIHNPLSVLLSYRATMRVPGRPGTYHTSTCPIGPHLFAVETWPYPIAELTLTDFKAMPQGGGIVCQ